MNPKQLFLLFLSGLVGWTTYQALFTVMAVYVTSRGADSASTGNYMALALGAAAAGTLASGWLSDRLQQRKALLIGTALLGVPATWLMGQTATFWQLSIVTVVAFFLVGLDLTLITILAGLFAREKERGQVFGLLAMNTGLSALIAGIVAGPIVESSGYPALFGAAAACWLVQPLIVLFLQDKLIVSARREPTAGLPGSSGSALGSAFYLLIAASAMAFASNFAAGLGRPLSMTQLGFDITAISSTVAVSGGVSLPFPLLFGWLSDRVDRCALIALCFFANMLGLIAMAAASSLWHFWMASILLSSVGATIGISQALMADLVPQETLGKALAWYSFAPTVSGIASLTLTGYAMTAFGNTLTFAGAAFLSLVAVMLVIQLQRTRRIAPA